MLAPSVDQALAPAGSSHNRERPTRPGHDDFGVHVAGHADPSARRGLEQTRARAALPPTDVAAAKRDWRGRLAASGRFVRVPRVFDESIDPDAPETRDERFDFGLTCVLDGIALRLP